MKVQIRTCYPEFMERVKDRFVTPYLMGEGPLSIKEAMERLGEFGKHGALDPVEGAVWRVERNRRRGQDWAWEVDFLVKYVRQEKIDGLYLDKDKEPILNEVI